MTAGLILKVEINAFPGMELGWFQWRLRLFCRLFDLGCWIMRITPHLEIKE